eukprot:CAMPEP_0197257788 /NCGR_PEP_ID=MMETSP1429-20130617/79939_1 /TAXON_ID=49237 /ORGANISM="Chaetoceros  sp., Strain UNC1202" /LENGTH=88 /DNA_ID=CAMNT_0042721725 /DNA_START=185 /DNA_END=447 /DNA_ORIENTATION=-
MASKTSSKNSWMAGKSKKTSDSKDLAKIAVTRSKSEKIKPVPGKVNRISSTTKVSERMYVPPSASKPEIPKYASRAPKVGKETQVNQT